MSKQRNKFAPPNHPLHAKLLAAGFSQLAAAHLIKVPYQRLVKYLTAYSQMPQDIERQLQTLLEKHAAGKGGAL